MKALMEMDDTKVYVNRDAFNFGTPEGYEGSFKWKLVDGTNIIFDFDQKCDDHVEMSVKHDGTLLFILECFHMCLAKMIDEPGATYIVGKITRMEEFDMDGTKFAPKEKPWCCERTTYRIEYKKENE